MTQKYNYELQKGSKHIICPNCRKKTFKPYVEAGTNNIVDAERYGRCERINNCSYIQYPESNGINSDWIAPPEQAYEPPRPDFIPKDLVEATFNQFETNVFIQYLRKLFGADKAMELQSNYNIGTASNNGTIYFQQDLEGNFRTGKVMYYNRNGNRDKNKNSWYIHKKVKSDFELVQVFFGEHLIKENPNKPIALVESEKSCVILSVFYPEITWLASGGINLLNIYRLSRLPRLDKVFPDQGAFDLWERNTKSMFMNRQMDVRVERAFRDGILKSGDDLLDLELIERGLNNVHI